MFKYKNDDLEYFLFVLECFFHRASLAYDIFILTDCFCLCKNIIETKDGPRGASIPSLGLSNKAIYEENNEEDVGQSQYDQYPDESYFREIHLEGKFYNIWAEI